MLSQFCMSVILVCLVFALTIVLWRVVTGRRQLPSQAPPQSPLDLVVEANQRIDRPKLGRLVVDLSDGTLWQIVDLIMVSEGNIAYLALHCATPHSVLLRARVHRSIALWGTTIVYAQLRSSQLETLPSSPCRAPSADETLCSEQTERIMKESS